jgi:hypothetical protein
MSHKWPCLQLLLIQFWAADDTNCKCNLNLKDKMYPVSFILELFNEIEKARFDDPHLGH